MERDSSNCNEDVFISNATLSLKCIYIYASKRNVGEIREKKIWYFLFNRSSLSKVWKGGKIFNLTKPYQNLSNLANLNDVVIKN